MRYFDLHCDTITEAVIRKQSLYNNNLQVDLKHCDLFETYIQCCAVFIEDNVDTKDCFNIYICYSSEFREYNTAPTNTELENTHKNGGYVLLPTIENAKALSGDIRNLTRLKKDGVRMMTLTWNADNELGGGIRGTGLGITEFGKSVVCEMDKLNMIVDVSHASEKLFYDICSITSKPIVASHSNVKNLCSNPRNLTDEQIKEIIRRKGLIGVNFYTPFLENDEETASIDSIAAHIEYILSLGGEKTVALGSDFDGATLPKDMIGLQSVPLIYEKMLRLNYKESMLDDIFYSNAYNFFISFDN